MIVDIDKKTESEKKEKAIENLYKFVEKKNGRAIDGLMTFYMDNEKEKAKLFANKILNEKGVYNLNMIGIALAKYVSTY